MKKRKNFVGTGSNCNTRNDNMGENVQELILLQLNTVYAAFLTPSQNIYYIHGDFFRKKQQNRKTRTTLEQST